MTSQNTKSSNFRNICNKITEKVQNTQHGREQKDGNWKEIKQVIIETADEIIGREGRTRRNEWFDEECAEATNKKNEAYRNMIHKHYSRGSEELYKERRRQEREKMHRQKKKFYLEENFKEIENLNSQNETSRFYKFVNDMRKEFRPNIWHVGKQLVK